MNGKAKSKIRGAQTKKDSTGTTSTEPVFWVLSRWAEYMDPKRVLDNSRITWSSGAGAVHEDGRLVLGPHHKVVTVENAQVLANELERLRDALSLTVERLRNGELPEVVHDA